MSQENNESTQITEEAAVETKKSTINKKRIETRKLASRLLITIAQTGAFNHKIIEEKMKKKYGDKISYCCIAKENHRAKIAEKDKGIHCHIFIHFRERIRYSLKPNTFSFLFNKAANIQQVKPGKKDRAAALSYVKKVEDYIEFGKNEVEEFRNEAPLTEANVAAYVLKMIQEGITIGKLYTHSSQAVKEYTLRNSVTVRRMINEMSYSLAYEAKEKLKGIRYIDDALMKERLKPEDIKKIEGDSGLRKIIEHINHITVYRGKRPFKMKNLLLWSKGPGKGKTSLFNKLTEYCPSYGFPRDGWFHGYESDCFWVIHWNEITFAGYDLEMLKNFYEGTPVKLRIKGSSVDKSDNPEILMTSNFNLMHLIEKKMPHAAYDERKTYYDAFCQRIEEVNIDAHENIFFLLDLIVPLEQ
jgi:hypothetical protein